MSNTSKTWLGVIVVAVIVIVGWIWYANSSSNSYSPAPVSQNNVVPNQPAANQVSVSTGTSAPGDSSNAALQQDMSAVDNQLNGINTDTSNATGGLNSSLTPTAQ